MHRQCFAFLVLVIAAGVFPRLYGWTVAPIWFDEAISFRMAHDFAFGEMIARTSRDVHPPLYYIVLRGWLVAFGHSVIALRSLSVLLSVVGIFAVYAFVSEMLDQNDSHQARFTGLLAAAFMAFTPALVEHAWNARMYGLEVFLIVLASLLLHRALRADRCAWAYWTGYVSLATGALYTHNFALFLVAAQLAFAIVYAAVRWWREGRGAFAGIAWTMGAVVLIALLYVPWLPTLLAQTERVRQDYWMSGFSLRSIPEGLCAVIFPENRGWLMTWKRPVAISAIWVAIPLVLMWRGAIGDWLVAYLVLLPIALAASMSLMLGRNMMHERYLSFPLVFLLVAVARLIVRIPWSELRWGLALVIFANLTYLTWHYAHDIRGIDRSGVRGAAEFVAGNLRVGDAVVVRSPYIYLSIDYYLRGKAQPLLFTSKRPVDHWEGGAFLHKGEWHAASQLDEVKADRIWVLNSRGYSLGDYSPLPQWWVCQNTKRFRDAYWWQREVEVTCYVTRTGTTE